MKLEAEPAVEGVAVADEAHLSSTAPPNPPATEPTSVATHGSAEKRAGLGIDPKLAWIAALSMSAVIATSLQIVLKTPDRGYFVPVLGWIVLGTMACLDVAYRRIPNALSYTAILLGLFLNGVMPLVTEALRLDTLQTFLASTTARDGFLGFAVCAGFGIVSFMLRGIGGGDAKALGAFGALLGFAKGWPSLANCLVLGAIISVANLLLKGELVRKLQSLMGAVFVASILKRRPDHVHIFGNREAPFVLSLFLGYLLSEYVQIHRIVMGILE